MPVYIHKNNQQSGPFEDVNILEWMRSGQLLPDDLACRTGGSSWQPLKVLFPSAPQQQPIRAAVDDAPVAPPVAGTEPVAAWAGRTFPSPLLIKLKMNSIFMKIIGFGMLLFFPVIFAAGTLFGLVTDGFQSAKSGLIITLIAFVFAAFIYLCIRLMRSNIARILDAGGAETIYGKRYRWENLRGVNYKKVKPRGILQVMLFAGAKRVNTELIFADGVTFIAPLSINQAEILRLLETIPVQRQGVEFIH